MKPPSAAVVALIVAVRKVWCEAEAYHLSDSEGDYTLVEVTTTDGIPMFEAYLEGHLSAAQVYQAASDLGTGRPTPAVNWIDASRSDAA